MTRLRPYAILILAVLAVFAGTAGFSYIGLDDAGYTFRNPFVATGLSLSNIVECFTHFRHGGIWMPITYISYMVDIEASKFLGVPLSVLMHIANVIRAIMWIAECRQIFIATKSRSIALNTPIFLLKCRVVLPIFANRI